MNLGSLLVQSLPIVLEGKASTNGTTTTVVDTSLTGKYDDDSFKEALVFIRKTTDGLAPQDQFSILTAFVDSSGTFTFSPAITVATGSGDYYAIADPQFQLVTVQRLVNQALRRMGIISLVDTSLTTLTNTLEYTLPLRLKAFPLDKVEIGNATDGFEENQDFYVLPSASGVQAKLVFNNQPRYDSNTASNCTIRIWYKDYHEELDTYEDVLNETVPEPLAIQYVRNEIMEWSMGQGRLSEEQLRRFQIQRGDLAQARQDNHINTANKKFSKFLSIRDLDPR